MPVRWIDPARRCLACRAFRQLRRIPSKRCSRRNDEYAAGVVNDRGLAREHTRPSGLPSRAAAIIRPEDGGRLGADRGGRPRHSAGFPRTDEWQRGRRFDNRCHSRPGDLPISLSGMQTPTPHATLRRRT